MKKRIPVLAFVLILALLVFFSSGSLSQSYEQILEAEYEQYSDMSKSDLTEELKTQFEAAAQNGDVDSLIVIASVFHERKNEFGSSEIFNFVLDDENDEFFRVTCVQILADMPSFSGSDTRLSSLLTASSTPPSLKQALIVHFGDKGGITQSNLEAMALSTDDAVGFHAIKKLKTVNISKAYNISKNILENPEDSTNGQIMAAVNLFSQLESGELSVLRTVDTANYDSTLMYSVCDTVLEGNYPQTAKDSVTLSMADMRNEEGIRYVLYNSNVDDIMKKTTVDRNYMTLIALLEEDGSADNIQLVSDCMELWPINELKVPLENAVSHLPVSRSSVNYGVSDVLQHIEDNGIDANTKWNQ